MKSIFLICSLLFWLIGVALSYGDDSLEVNYYTPENIYKFANALYAEGDYARAAAEYRRYLHFSEITTNEKSAIEYEIGLCYKKAEQYTKAIDHFRLSIDCSGNIARSDTAHYQIGLAYFGNEQYDNSSKYINTFITEVKSDSVKNRMSVIRGINCLYRRNWQDARKTISSFPEGYWDVPVMNWFDNISDQASRINHKSPLAAGVMSTLIPGSGKIYASRFRDGVYSMVIIGLTAWQAYDGFDEHGTNSTKGWIYSTIGGVFYLGNIYGSAVAAKIYNNQQEDKFLTRLGAEFILYFD